MILAVNIGNTNIRAALRPKELIRTNEIMYRPNCPAYPTGAVRAEKINVRPYNSDIVIPADALLQSGSFIHLMEQHFGVGLWERIEGSIVSSVVPRQTSVIVESILDKTGIRPQRIDVQKCGELSIQQYVGMLGEDRAVCCAGALLRYKPPFIIIDFGTATTINVVSGNKEFLGGAILTGVRTGLKALAGNTALLPQIDDMNSDTPCIGKSTRENLVSGAIIGAACAVEGYIHRIECEMNCAMPVVVTGGNAPMVLPYCNFENIHEPDLLVDGLFSLYECI